LLQLRPSRPAALLAEHDTPGAARLQLRHIGRAQRRSGQLPGCGQVSTYSVVLPTVGRPSLTDVLTDLHRQSGPAPQEVIVVDDRPLVDTADLELPDGAVPVRVLRSGGRGPAAARNAGWRTATTEWVAFLDDDVRLPADWSDRLA